MTTSAPMRAYRERTADAPLIPQWALVPAQAIVEWHAAGRPAGQTGYRVRAAAVSWLRDVKAFLAAGRLVSVAAVGSVGDDTAITPTTFRLAYRVYEVAAVLTGASGEPTGIVLRDPAGQTRTLTDPTRIYFCLTDAWTLDW